MILSCTRPRPFFLPRGGGSPQPIASIDDVQCYGPLYGRSGRVIWLPCGSCVACRRERRQDYTALQVLESLCWDDSWFLTLTYDDSHLPDLGTLVPKHLSTFFESLRHYCKYRRVPCRYFAVGEYGDRYHRPHYHASLFGLSAADLGLRVDDSELARSIQLSRGYLDRHIKDGVTDENGNRYWYSKVISDRWPYGHHQIYRANRYTFQYVAGYASKKLFGSARADFIKSGRVPSYSIQSRPSVGFTWWKRNHKRLSLLLDGKLIHDEIDVPGIRWRTPRIFEKWLSRPKNATDEEREYYQEIVKPLRSAKHGLVPDFDDLSRKDKHDLIMALRHFQSNFHPDLSGNSAGEQTERR